ncbi:MAG: hypothetical protein QOJ70_535 [Acidobacteriota bacterium]|jgi:hypothetical protein|nr:hypothetical protein [Acidobacteriota bacterium]
MISPALKTHFYLEPSARFNRLPLLSVNQRLLVRSAPKPDESLMGFLVRLTEENGYDTPSWIMRFVRVDYKQLNNCAIAFKPAEELIKLAALTGNEVSALTALGYPPADISGQEDIVLFEGTPIYKYLINVDSPRVCPECLRDFGYCRRVWDLSLVTACALHRRLLLDKCPKCVSALRHNRGSMSICLCGYDYRDAEPHMVTENEAALDTQIHLLCNVPGIFPAEVRRENPLAELNLPDLITLMVFIFGQLRDVLTTVGRKHIKACDIHKLHEVFTKAYSIFDAFPQRYNEFLEWRQQSDERQGRQISPYCNGLGRRFGSFYEGVYRNLKSPTHDFLRAAFSEYVRTSWQGNYVTKAECPNAATYIGQDGYLTLNEARKQLGVDVRYIEYLITTQHLKAAVRKTGNKSMFLIDARSFDQVKREHDGSITADIIAKRLDISKETVRMLVSNCCLTALPTPKQCGFKLWRFREGSAEELIQAIRSKILPQAKSRKGNTLSFRAACRELMGFNIKISSVVKLMLQRKLVPCDEVRRRIGLSRFDFDEDTFRAFKEQCIIFFAGRDGKTQIEYHPQFEEEFPIFLSARKTKGSAYF